VAKIKRRHFTFLLVANECTKLFDFWHMQTTYETITLSQLLFAKERYSAKYFFCLIAGRLYTLYSLLPVAFRS